jgi:glycosyltransferase involved in cell wall biosynthesis
MKESLVTVFIPVFNAEKYIATALTSITEQSYKNIEILIINDGSSDRSKNIINSFLDPRIKIINNKGNMGLPYTRALALSISNGKYLAFLDSDDYSRYDRIAKQVRFLEENNECDIVFTDFNIIDKRRVKTKKKLNNNKIKYSLLYKNIICNSSVMIRKEPFLIEKLTYNNNYFVAQDYRLWADCISLLNFGYIPERLVNYRICINSVTKKSYQDETKVAKRLELINLIHKAVFKNLNIQLKDNELALFNKIFNESIYAKDATYNEIISLFEFLKAKGKNEIIYYNDWIEILENNILKAMLNSKNVSLLNSILFYLKNMKSNKLFNFMLIVYSIVFSHN